MVEVYHANALMDAHLDDPEFGYRFLVGEAAEAGEEMCEQTAWKICRDNQWWSVFEKKRGKNGKRPGIWDHAASVAEPPLPDGFRHTCCDCGFTGELARSHLYPEFARLRAAMSRAPRRRHRRSSRDLFLPLRWPAHNTLHTSGVATTG